MKAFSSAEIRLARRKPGEIKIEDDTIVEEASAGEGIKDHYWGFRAVGVLLVLASIIATGQGVSSKSVSIR